MGLKYYAYANANDFGVTCSDATLANARSGTGTLALFNASGTMQPIGQELNGTTYKIGQAFLQFDTTIFPASGGTVTFHFVGSQWSTGSQAFNGNLNLYQYAWASAATSEFRTPTQLAALTKLGSGDPGVNNTVTLSSCPSSATLKAMVAANADETSGTAPTGIGSTFAWQDSGNASYLLFETSAPNGLTSKTITATGTGSITVGGAGANDPPSTVTAIQIECWGAGGSSATNTGQKAGGASGAYVLCTIPVTNGDIIYYSIPAGQTYNGSAPADTWARKNTNSAPTASSQGALADSANNATAGAIANCIGMLTVAGTSGQSAQAGGGSRAGSGGSGSPGPDGSGTIGTAGSSNVAGTGGAGDNGTVTGNGTSNALGGSGGNGSVAGATATAGGAPGAGGGGGGSSSGASGAGGRGQVVFTWETPAAVSAAPCAYAQIIE